MASKTIPGFCQARNVSESFFHKMQVEGWGPDLMFVGDSTRISDEADAVWEKERELAAKLGIRRALPPDVKAELRARLKAERKRLVSEIADTDR